MIKYKIQVKRIKCELFIVYTKADKISQKIREFILERKKQKYTNNVAKFDENIPCLEK